jgi:hypothetical protein
MAASDEALTRSSKTFESGGMAIRIACGKMMPSNVRYLDKPRDAAVSSYPRSIESKAERMIFAMYVALFKLKPVIAAVNAFS